MNLKIDGDGLWEMARWSEMVSKSGNLATRDVFAKQLLQINGVSGARAKAIVDRYACPLQLAQAYEACHSHQQRLLLLADVPCANDATTTTTHGRSTTNTKKLGAALSQRICEFYWPAHHQLISD